MWASIVRLCGRLWYDVDWFEWLFVSDLRWRVNVFCAVVFMGVFVMVLRTFGMGKAGVCVTMAMMIPVGLVLFFVARRHDQSSLMAWCLKNLGGWMSFAAAVFLGLAAVMWLRNT